MWKIYQPRSDWIGGGSNLYWALQNSQMWADPLGLSSKNRLEHVMIHVQDKILPVKRLAGKK